jgi:hypothetical protein
MSYRETEHLRVLIANERKDRLALVAPIVVGLGHEVIAREIDVADVGPATARERPDVALVGLGDSPQHALSLIDKIVREAVTACVTVHRHPSTGADRGHRSPGGEARSSLGRSRVGICRHTTADMEALEMTENQQDATESQPDARESQPDARESQPDARESQPEAKWSVAEWHGKMLLDCDGEKIGKLQDVYVNVEDDVPQFATVKEGFISRHLTFVPLGGIKIGPDDLQVAVTKEQVESAPNIEEHGEELSQEDESALYHHFELNYTPPDTESGRLLARR